MTNFIAQINDKKFLISIFLIFHLTSIFWVAFAPANLKFKILPISAYIHLFGLYQNWLMFEKPTTGNYYLLALIESSDGKKVLVNFPHMDELSGWDTLKYHRFRKFQQSSVFNPSNQIILPDLAIWFINGINAEDREKVSSVTLFQKKVSLKSGDEQSTAFFVFRPEHRQ